MKTWLLATSALLALQAVPASAAEVQVGFDWPSLSFTDLDPADGIAPSWTLSDRPDAGGGYSRYSEIQDGGTILPGGDCGGFSGCVSTSTSGAAYSVANFIGIEQDHILSPHTSLTATFQVLASSVALPGEIVTASVDLTLISHDVPGLVSNRVITLDGTDSFSGMVSLTLTNNTGNPMAAVWYGALSYSADGRGSPAPPVPEPQTWALMALGLAGVAGATRRRLRGDGAAKAVA